MSAYTSYRQHLISRFWKYQEQRFPYKEEFFEQPFKSESRPPVFLKGTADHNVLVEPGTPSAERRMILNQIPVRSRHRWFRSMTSSQALAQSIFGNLKAYDRLHLLNSLLDDQDIPLFGTADVTVQNLSMEHNVDFFQEPRPTSVDVFVAGEYQVAIECKLSEREVGVCSRPLLTKSASNYDTDYCDASYTRQRGRTKRCTLSQIGVLYWQYIPKLFAWKNDTDYNPCPLYRNYQLIRNVLAACIRPDGDISGKNGHAVLIYDHRNPEYQNRGRGSKALEETEAALKHPALLRKCSWQRILDHLRSTSHLRWLTNEIKLKYGL